MNPDEDLLHDCLDRWEDALGKGEDLSAETLCGDRADLVAELDRRIRALRRFRSVTGHMDAETGPRPPPRELLHDRFRIERRLGGGTEGDVWLAFDTLIRRYVAVKRPRQGSQDLLDEARLIASLQHPNIRKVLDVGHDGAGEVFVVMELMAGKTLAERIHGPDGTPIPPARAIAWTSQIASALQAVHLAGRAHRDVKPVNILLDEHDNAVLADFGIAIDVTSQEPGGSTGTPAYKSPEQLTGGKLDARSDVYSLGLCVHEMLAGALPFSDLADRAAIESEITTGVDMRVSRRVPTRLRPVVSKALSRYPAMRHDSAPEFARDLDHAWRRSRVGRWVAVATLVLAAGTTFLSWRLRQDYLRTVQKVRKDAGEASKAFRDARTIHSEATQKLDSLLDLRTGVFEGSRNGVPVLPRGPGDTESAPLLRRPD